MKQVTFLELIAQLDELPRGAGIYCDPERWERGPLDAPLFLADASEEDDLEWDDKIAALGLQELFRVPVLRSVVRRERTVRPSASLSDLLAAAQHYLRFDAFR